MPSMLYVLPVSNKSSSKIRLLFVQIALPLRCRLLHLQNLHIDSVF